MGLETLFKGNPPVSSLGFKYPMNRDDPLKSTDSWLDGKRADDGAEGLWRIHDCLYDFTDFVKTHPGGQDWLILTKGTDITEAFECHHLTNLPEKILFKYFIRKATTKRNSPFTFKEDGFYRTLKQEIAAAIKEVPEAPADRSKLYTDSLLAGHLFFCICATYFQSYILGILSGVILAMLANAAHNFFHQKDNFRMYYFDLCLMSSRGWRVSHALSHHLYTNTIQDMEISTLEPFLNYLPSKKPLLFRHLAWFYSPVFYTFMTIGYSVRLFMYNIVNKQNIRPESLLPGLVVLLMLIISRYSFFNTILMFGWIHMMSGLYFGFIGVNAAHHHPDIFHDGDKPRSQEEMDWGFYQMDAVMDRTDITGSHFLVLTNFGDHCLHHLFPTIDHGKLEYLYPVFNKVCDRFGVKLRMTKQVDLIIGQYRQLVKEKPNRKPPAPLQIQKN